MKADHNTIMLFGVKVMSKYKVLSKRECGMIKKLEFQIADDAFMHLWPVA